MVEKNTRRKRRKEGKEREREREREREKESREKWNNGGGSNGGKVTEYICSIERREECRKINWREELEVKDKSLRILHSALHIDVPVTMHCGLYSKSTRTNHIDVQYAQKKLPCTVHFSCLTV